VTTESAKSKERGSPSANGKKIIATYDYTDEDGVPLFQVARFDPKDFKQRRPNGKGGWIWSIQGVRLVPYRLHELADARPQLPVLIVEGEKDADNLAALEFLATCNPMGAGKWRADYNEYFRGRPVFILPDADEPGRKHAQDVARHLHGIAAGVTIVELPGLSAKEDVSDWLAAGGDKEKLLKLALEAPEWKPAGDSNNAKESAKAEGLPEKKKVTQAEALVALAKDKVKLFHTPGEHDSEGYAIIEVSGHKETWPINSKGFRRWLCKLFWDESQKVPGPEPLQAALNVLSGNGGA
jgi:hypothetical protein